MTNVVQQSMRDLRRDIEEKNQSFASFLFLIRTNKEIFLSRVTNDVDAVSNAMQQSFYQYCFSSPRYCDGGSDDVLNQSADGDFFQ